MRKRIPPSPSALTDIAFLLLLFFLIMAITSFQISVPFVPAQAEGRAIDLTHIPTLFIAKNGDMYQEGKMITLDLIVKKSAYALLADKATEYGAIHPIIEELKAKGVETLYLLVEDPQ